MRFSAALLFPLGAVGWWDEGHALGTTVAKLSMDGNANLQKIEAIMDHWNHWYPGLGNLHFSSIWADHVKCSGPAPWCGTTRYDNLRPFYEWHWESHNWVANDDIDIKDKLENHFPLEGTGALWSMERMLVDLTFGNDNPGNVHELQGTFLGANMQLFLLAHFYTDVHNPCHTMETWAWPVTGGDQGANRWIIDSDSAGGGIGNMHAWWDSMGGTARVNWPELQWDHLETRASALMAKWPKDHEKVAPRLAGDLSGLNITAMGEESATLGREMVFGAFDFEKDCPGKEKCCPYEDGVMNETATATVPPTSLFECGAWKVTDDYKTKSIEDSELQVVLSGYRFANLLNYIAPFLPDPAVIEPPPGIGSPAFAIATAMGLILVGMGVFL